MSQRRTTPEAGQSSEPPGHGSGALSRPSPPGGAAGPRAAVQGPGPEADSIKELLGEFRQLYEQRLNRLELDTAATREELLQVRRS